MRTQGFLGAIERRRQAGHFQFSLMQATVPAEAVDEHAHVDAHWVLAWGGDYRTRADDRGGPASATLVLNPPETEHRDCFGAVLGRFMTVSWSSADWQQIAEVVPLPTTPTQIPMALALATRLSENLAIQANDLDLESLALQLIDRAGRDTGLGSALPWLRRAEEFMCAQPDCPDVRTLSAAVGVHPVSLARLLRQHSGETPAAFLLRHRIERARCWLRVSDRSVTEIALDLGFADAAHFSHSFRRVLGFSPRQYRQGTA